jgi:hypothetical protein
MTEAARNQLLLHVGHAKTGATALQAALARSIPDLASHGIHYPAPPDAETGRAGQAPGANLHAPDIAERYRAERRRAEPDHKILFSAEAGFYVFPEDPSALSHLLADGVAIEVILFIRNPATLARAVYAQMVQRLGVTEDFDTFLVEFGFLHEVERFLDLATELGLPIWVWNYSDDPNAVLPVMEDILSVPPGTLEPAHVPPVSRSLTRMEIKVVQALIASHGAGAAAAAADALCARLPDIPPDPPMASAAAYSAFSRRIAPQIARINARLDPSVQYRLEAYEEAFGTTVSPLPEPVSAEQRAVIDAALADWQRNAAVKLGRAGTQGGKTPGGNGLFRWLRDRLPR